MMIKVILTHFPIECEAVRLLTLMYIDSLMVLAKPWSSLPMMLKFSGLVLCPVLVLCPLIGEDSFRSSLDLPKRSCLSLMYSSLHLSSPHWYQWCHLLLHATLSALLFQFIMYM